MPREGIDPDPRLLSDRHVGELGLLVVRDHPDLGQRGQRGDLGSDTDQLPGLHLALTEDPVLRCGDGGVLQVEVGAGQRGACRHERRGILFELRLQHRQLALGGCLVRAALGDLRLELSVLRLQLLACLGRRGAGPQQLTLPREIAAILLPRGDGGGDHGPRRLHIGELELALGLQRLALRGDGQDARLRLVDGRAIVDVDQASQHLPFVHPLVILDGKLADVAGHLGRDGRQIRLQVGIVGALPALPALPAVPVAGHDDDDGDGDDEDENSPRELKDLVPIELDRRHGLVFLTALDGSAKRLVGAPRGADPG